MLRYRNLLFKPQTVQPMEQGGAAVLEGQNYYCVARCTCRFSSTAVQIVLI
jgi:hypothetical protein